MKKDDSGKEESKGQFFEEKSQKGKTEKGKYAKKGIWKWKNQQKDNPEKE